jgi:hypothetical protein
MMICSYDRDSHIYTISHSGLQRTILSMSSTLPLSTTTGIPTSIRLPPTEAAGSAPSLASESRES